MGYLTATKQVADISFEKVCFKTSIVEATKIREEILEFFKKNPDGEVRLQFGGYARLSPEFAKELYKDEAMKAYYTKISTWGLHVLDEQIMSEALRC